MSMSFVDFMFYPAVIGLVFFLLTVQLCFRKQTALSKRLKKLTLLAFSYLAMGMYDWRFCICMTAVISVTWFSALAIEGAKIRGNERQRNMWTGCSVAFLVLLLGLFKYLNFFMDSLCWLVGKEWHAIAILLPLGISFYIFSAIGYILDVSWGNAEAEKDFFDVALFLAFFLKMVCGPIVRGRDFLPQLKENRKITWKGVETGMQIFVFGFFKKLVLADHLAVFVDDVYAAPAAFGTFTVWLAAFSYFIQLYFDFSGYSDMAVGISKILGYDIQKNFNLPFVAKNISEFWDRWHISLSSWLNEYIFNPLALRMKRRLARLPKARRMRWRMLPDYAALVVTFFVSGLWHGAGVTFLIWGALQGICSVWHAIYVNWRKSRKANVEGKTLRSALKQSGGGAVL